MSEPSHPHTVSETPKSKVLQRAVRILLLIFVVGSIFLIWYFDLGRFVSLDTLRTYRQTIDEFVQNNYLLAILIACAVYTLAIAVSLPGGALMSVTMGFVFGPLIGTAMVVFSATTGASILFLLAKGILGDHFLSRLGPWMGRLEGGFRKNAFNYILALRLIPAVPFSILNPIPALFGVSLTTYVAATFLGIIPGSYVFVALGEGLGSVLDQGGELNLRSAITTEMIVALVGLAILALLPVGYQFFKQRRGGS